ncbi:MAG: class I SAM-dependent methyltransferase [Candidatus Bathyarchaeia archaeon]
MIDAKKEEPSETCCPLCGSATMEVFYEQADVPASCNLLWTSKRAAVSCPKGNIRLAFCDACSYIVNVALEPSKNQYTERYDNSLFFSNDFRTFTKKMATELVQRFDLHNKRIVEIGGGKVDFLSDLCKIGNNHGVRLNPFDSDAARNKKRVSGSPRTAKAFTLTDSEKLNADFAFSYHELEHMNSPRAFLDALRKMLSNNPRVRFFFAVPNALKAFEDGCFADIIYEHVSYFTPASLASLFSLCGFDVLQVEESRGSVFDSIYIEATIGNKKRKASFTSGSEQVRNTVAKFADKTSTIIEENNGRIARLLDQGKRVVVWGTGARGVTLLNTFKDQRIEYAVDLNPRKQGMYVPGTGQRIVSPEFLRDHPPDFIVLANPSYEREIRDTVNNLGIETEFIKF